MGVFAETAMAGIEVEIETVVPTRWVVTIHMGRHVEDIAGGSANLVCNDSMLSLTTENWAVWALTIDST
jgi:hypothetical protein